MVKIRHPTDKEYFSRASVDFGYLEKCAWTSTVQKQLYLVWPRCPLKERLHQTMHGRMDVVQHLGRVLCSEKSQDFGVRTIKLGELTSIGGDQSDADTMGVFSMGESERRQDAAGSRKSTSAT